MKQQYQHLIIELVPLTTLKAVVGLKKTTSPTGFLYNEEAPCTSHTSCAKVAILLLQDLSTLCVTDIYGIYFRFSVLCT